jgi:hypothetical protein
MRRFRSSVIEKKGCAKTTQSEERSQPQAVEAEVEAICDASGGE